MLQGFIQGIVRGYYIIVLYLCRALQINIYIGDPFSGTIKQI